MNSEQEAKIAEFWKKHGIYKKAVEKNAGKKKFYFVDGPPYATGYIHMGTALNKILKDVYLRYRRMTGFDVWDQPGYDTHGLPIENKVEKKFNFKLKSDIEVFGIVNFIEECRKFATEFIDIMSGQFEDLGVWMDWANPYLTLTNDYIEGAWQTFKIGYDKGLLYKGLYPVHVCPHCETAVAYNEIEYRTVSDPSIFVKFQVEGSDNEYLLIWTTTPWTLPANTGIMANPKALYARVKTGRDILILAEARVEDVMKSAGIDDYEILEKLPGNKLEGMKYRNPMEDIFEFQRTLNNGRRVVLSEQFVSLEDGTGLVHTAPGHGKEDYKVGAESGLPMLSPVKLNGCFDDTCGKYSGMFVKDADRRIIDELVERGALLHQESLSHEYPQCWRCKSLLIMTSVPQWFFKITDIKQKLLDENRHVSWFPKWGGQRFDNWLESIGDWPISRQRYWGIPLPIWECEKCDKIKIIGSMDELPEKINDLHRPYIDEVKMNCKCGGKMNRIPDVLDVWFDSGLASWASIGYTKDKKLFNRLWPADLNIEGSDQIRGWWNSEMITSVITFNKAPFKNILFHGLVLDLHGNKMSKSVGNIVAPEDVVKKHGRDVLRYYMLSSPPWEDFYFNWAEADMLAKNFIVMENSFNFVRTYVSSTEKKKLNTEDAWILSKLNSLIKSYKENGDSYNMHKVCNELKEFILEDFSRTYIKLIRDRVWPSYSGADKKAAEYTLYTVAEKTSVLLAPIAPFMAEHIYQNVVKPLGGKAESVHLLDFPKADESMIDEQLEKRMSIARKAAEAAAALRQEKAVKLRWPLAALYVECDDDGMVKELADILKRMCNVKEVKTGPAKLPSRGFDGGTIYLEIKLTEELKQEALFREVIRKIQDMRKKSGMVIADRINIILAGADELKIYEKTLMKEVGAVQIIFGKAAEGEELKFEDRTIIISIGKK
jgi:isoleucyl-tRNA synthetase